MLRSALCELYFESKEICHLCIVLTDRNEHDLWRGGQGRAAESGLVDLGTGAVRD